MKSKQMRIANCLVVFILMFLVSCSSRSEKHSAETAKVEEKKPAMHTVEMTQMKFNPAELKVKKGDKIIFVNHDIVAHDVTETSTKAWNSSPMADGQSWTLVATETVDYYCSIHPVMKGKVVVE
jgi:plastocyanin